MACPYEGRKDGNAVSGCKEIIAASADTNADLEEHSPFSRAVAKALFQHMGKDLMTRELYDTLCSLGLRHRPIHIILSSHKEDPIMLGLTSPAKNNPRKSRPRQRGVKVDVVVERSPAASDQLVRMGAWMENTMSLRRLPGKTASSISDQLSISFSGTSSVANDSQRWGESTRKAPPIVKSALRNAQLQVTHEPASPPPEGRVSTTSFEIEDLVQSMNINMEIQNNLTRSGNYSSVSVLPIMFEAVEAELGLEADLESLRTCFLERFKFHVYDVFKIPSVNAESALLSRIINLTRDHGLKDDLIIVVYAGHGIDPSSLRREVGMPMGPAIWAPYVYFVPSCRTSR